MSDLIGSGVTATKPLEKSQTVKEKGHSTNIGVQKKMILLT
jgi:hypothetical protein